MDYLPKDPKAEAEKVLKIGSSHLFCDSSQFGESIRESLDIILENTTLPLTNVISISVKCKQSFDNDNWYLFKDIKLSFINNDVCSKSIVYSINVFKSTSDGRLQYFLENLRATVDIKAKSTTTIALDNFFYKKKSDESWKLIFQIEEILLTDFKTNPSDRMIEEFSKTFDDDTFKDIKFVVGDESFMAHKFVVAARSEVFHAMLAHDTKERKEGVIEIQDVGLPALKSFIKFLYTDQVEGIEELVVELLMLGDKYNVSSLQDKCRDYISMNNTINESNVINYLIKAHKNNSELLKKLALLHIRFYIKKLVETKDLDLLYPYLSLMKEVITVMADDDADSSAKRLGISR